MNKNKKYIILLIVSAIISLIGCFLMGKGLDIKSNAVGILGVGTITVGGALAFIVACQELE